MKNWDVRRWPHFRPEEIACPCCGEVTIDPRAMDALERVRFAINRPIHINSGHRCAKHNRQVGGAVNSTHLTLAFDVVLSGATSTVTSRDWRALHDAAIRAGFNGIGYAETYIHLDTRPEPARWHYSEKARALWSTYLFGHILH